MSKSESWETIEDIKEEISGMIDWWNYKLCEYVEKKFMENGYITEKIIEEAEQRGHEQAISDIEFSKQLEETIKNKNSQDDTCYLYFVSDGNSYCKIGISNSPENRLKSLQTGSGYYCTIIRTIKFEKRIGAMLCEKSIHEYLKDHSCKTSNNSSEWFSIDGVCEILSLSDEQIKEKFFVTNFIKNNKEKTNENEN